MTRTLCIAVLLLGFAACNGQAPKTQLKTAVPTNSSAAKPHPAHTNRLARAKSPYLLQHQHNPVNWFPWGDEAFAKARQENKPIFLSIGYSTCHWCHVMERESFENEETAAYLNEHFVSIKVDREERPDVDKIYMTFVQAMTGQGGWPLNVFLAPDLKPFYGGTYWPPEDKHGRTSFVNVLKQIDQAWQTKREQLTNSSLNLHQKLIELTARQGGQERALSAETLASAGKELKEGYDERNGGWGSAPGMISQTIVTTPGVSYTLSFSYSGHPYSGCYFGPKPMRANAGSASTTVSADPLAEGYLDGTNLWHTASLNFKASNTSTVISFTSLENDGTCAGPLVDDVWVLPLPPSAQPQLVLAPAKGSRDPAIADARDRDAPFPFGGEGRFALTEEILDGGSEELRQSKGDRDGRHRTARFDGGVRLPRNPGGLRRFLLTQPCVEAPRLHHGVSLLTS